MPTPPDDILLNKAAIIERCVRRMLEEAKACPDVNGSVRKLIDETPVGFQFEVFRLGDDP